MQVNQKIKTLFEEEKMDEIVEDCKFIFLPESQTISGRSGACGQCIIVSPIDLETYHYTLCITRVHKMYPIMYRCC